MALPNLINAASPADADNPAAGAAQIRGLKQFLEDLFGLTDSLNYTVGGVTISSAGVVSFSVAPVMTALTASLPVFMRRAILNIISSSSRVLSSFI